MNLLSGYLPIFAAGGPPSSASSASDWAAMILRELGRSQAAGFILDVAKWTCIGTLMGGLIAAAACGLFSRLGWYQLRWRFARGVRWAIFGLTVGLCAVLFGLVGFWSGAMAGSERVLAKSQLATEVFPKIADEIADLMAWVQVRPQFSGITNEAELSVKLDEFRAGKWELHAARFLQHLDELKEAALTNLVAKIEQSALEQTPKLKGGLGEKLLHQLLNGVGRLLIERKAARELKGWGADRIYFTILGELKTEAARAGDPDTITRGEISALLVREGIVPGLLQPIRSTARAQQLALILLAIVALLLPPLCLRLARSRFNRPVADASPVPPARPTA